MVFGVVVAPLAETELPGLGVPDDGFDVEANVPALLRVGRPRC
jgi:hypothetical protein